MAQVYWKFRTAGNGMQRILDMLPKMTPLLYVECLDLMTGISFALGYAVVSFIFYD
jgi:hypothetical protein